MSKPRILLFTNTVAPYRLPVFEQLGQFFDLHVFFAEGKTAERQWDVSLRHYNISYTILDHKEWRLGAFRQIVNWDLLSHLWHNPFDAIILGDNRQTILSTFILIVIAYFCHRPVIVWTGITPGEVRVARGLPVIQSLYSLYRRWFFRWSKTMVAYSSATKEYLIDMGISSNKVFVGTQTMPLEQLPNPKIDKGELGVGAENLVLSVNYLLPRKGLDVLIKAFQQVAGTNDMLALVGSGPELEKLQHLVNKDDRILFPGYQTNANKTSWYAASDIFVFPTLHDPWGLVVNEAMTFGLPIITTDEAGCASDLVKDNGLIVQAGDVDALATALYRLLEDKELRQKMGKRSKSIIAGYSVDWACNTFRQAINYALENI